MGSQSRGSRWLAGALVGAMLLPAGCAQPRPPPLELHLALQQQSVAVVPAAFPVVDRVELFAKSRPAGALFGAGRGAVEGLGMLAGSSCEGEVCGAALVLALAVAVVAGGTVGAVTGALQATPHEEAERIEATVERSVDEFPAHLDLARRVVEAAAERAPGVRLEPAPAAAEGDAARGYAPLRARGFGRVLEVGVRRIEFGGGRGSDPELALEIEASARLFEAETGAVAYAREFQHTGAARRFSAWTRGGGAEMRRALAQGLAALADDIANAIFVQTDLGISSGSWAFPGTHRYGTCWLTPRSPPNDYGFLSQALEYPVVASLQPTFEWDPFPDARQRAQLRRKIGREIGAVRYELRIWNVRGDERADLVYERRDLPHAAHRLEQPLSPRRRYFWSIRACFTADGAGACTPWASSLLPSRGGRTCESPDIPAWNHFRFATR
jgi:hypothetical protein